MYQPDLEPDDLFETLAQVRRTLTLTLALALDLALAEP